MHRYRVALSFHWPFSYGWRIVQGVLDYARAQAHWEIVTPFFNVPVAHILENRERIDGLITDLSSRDDLPAVQALDKPTVECANIVRDHGFPRVGSAERVIGRLAAEFFLEREASHFAYCGFHGQCYSQARSIGYREVLRRLGYHTVHRFDGPFENAPASSLMLDELADWLRGLPQPCAVFACNDLRALQLHQACQLAGLQVPQQLSILGVDNEESLMRLYGFALSSIEQDAERIGWEAAAMLDRWMQGQARGKRDRLRLIPPLRAVARDSTPAHRPHDPIVAAAMALLRHGLAEDRGIDTLLESVPASRRSIERRFRQSLGLSPKEYLTRFRMERACQLLRETASTIGEIATAVGYAEQRRFSEVFRQQIGSTPREYRKLRLE